MSENLQDDLYQLEKIEEKVLNFVLTSDRSWKGEIAQKRFSKYLKNQNLQKSNKI